MCTLSFESITVTFDSTGQPKRTPSSTITRKRDNPKGDIKKQAIGIKSANIPEESNFDLKKTIRSNTKYTEVAPLVNLDPAREFNDCPRCYIPRSRITSALLKEIVMDMGLVLLLYGPVQCYRSAEARSKFLAPILNRLLAQFGGTFRRKPETGCDATQGKTVHHLKCLGIPMVVYVETSNGSVDERLSAIAQVIAECNVCDNENKALGFDVPVYGILCDGNSYHFFSLDGKSQKFSAALTPGSYFQGAESKGLPLVYVSPDCHTARPFLDSLRPICETIFNILLTSYTASLKAHHDRAESQPSARNPEDLTVYSWYTAVKFADEALRFSKDAEWIRRNESIAKGNARTESIFSDIKRSLAKVPIAREYVRPSLMDAWHNDA